MLNKNVYTTQPTTLFSSTFPLPWWSRSLIAGFAYQWDITFLSRTTLLKALHSPLKGNWQVRALQVHGQRHLHTPEGYIWSCNSTYHATVSLYLSFCLLHVRLKEAFSAPHFLQLLVSPLTFFNQLYFRLKQRKWRNNKVVPAIQKYEWLLSHFGKHSMYVHKHVQHAQALEEYRAGLSMRLTEGMLAWIAVHISPLLLFFHSLDSEKEGGSQKGRGGNGMGEKCGDRRAHYPFCSIPPCSLTPESR